MNVFLISARQVRPAVPPLWKQSWFRVSAAIVLAFLFWGCWHLIAIARLKRALRHVQHQRTIELERLRIAQDLHDQLGSSLTTITLLSEVARRSLEAPEKAEGHLNHLTGTARSLTRALEEIVWAVNPRKDRLDQLVSYFSAYAEEFLKPTELRCRLDFPDELPEWAVSSELRHELFLVFKEALTNVVKHAAAGEVRIRMALHERQLALTIEDDGCGFDPAAIGFARNGITNMRSRIEKLGGTCEISSEPGKGSRVHVEASLEDAAAAK